MNCSIVNYRLVQINSKGEVEQYGGEHIKIDSSFNISVNTSNAMDTDLFLEASSKNSNKTALLDLKVYVKNYPPYFKDGPPEHQIIEFSEDEEFTFEIPEITDLEDLDLT